MQERLRRFAALMTMVLLGAAAALAQSSNRNSSAADAAAHITAEQAKILFGSVDTILRFDSGVTGLPVEHSVKRKLITRDEVESYLNAQLKNDRDARRLERSELVMKKFGLLDRDFELGPFLVRLLREQIAGYYDDKTKTVNLLDWIPPEEQKPVLAHELTHALQDQHIPLRKWERQADLSVAKNMREDNEHIATDEQDTARDAVLEGQAMAAFIDYALAPAGKNLLSAPELADKMNEAMSDTADSPELADAPLVLQRSLLFPYVDGLNFVRAVWTAKGRQAAFAGMLDRPPSSTYEIMTPRVYLKRGAVPLLEMPDIHPLLGPEYRPYDVGVMGEFDVAVMAELFGGADAAKRLAPAWRGGVYYAAQSRSAKDRDLAASLALLYLSEWQTPAAARDFADLYAREISRKYSDAIVQPEKDDDGETPSRVWSTAEGPVVIAVSGKTVFISESFPLELAGKLETLMIGSVADSSRSVEVRSAPPERMPAAGTELTAALRQMLAGAGVMNVQAAAKP